MDHRSLIAGAGLLLDVFGRWPDFHDAEVLRLTLDRDESEPGGPTLQAWLRAFGEAGDVGPNGAPGLRRRALVHFRFQGVVSLCIREWNERNALFDLRLIDAREREVMGVDFEVMFDGAFGVDAAFGCRRVEVVSAAPLGPDEDRRDGGAR